MRDPQTSIYSWGVPPLSSNRVVTAPNVEEHIPVLDTNLIPNLQGPETPEVKTANLNETNEYVTSYYGTQNV